MLNDITRVFCNTVSIKSQKNNSVSCFAYNIQGSPHPTANCSISTNYLHSFKTTTTQVRLFLWQERNIIRKWTDISTNCENKKITSVQIRYSGRVAKALCVSVLLCKSMSRQATAQSVYVSQPPAARVT